MRNCLPDVSAGLADGAVYKQNIPEHPESWLDKEGSSSLTILKLIAGQNIVPSVTWTPLAGKLASRNVAAAGTQRKGRVHGF